MIPGLNILAVVFGAIGTQTIKHLAASGRTQNAVGAWVTSYAAPADVQASVQPASYATIKQLGLDLGKSYHTIWLKANIQGIMRGESPSRFIFSGRLHEVVYVKDWYGQDGWVEVSVVDIGAAP